MQVTTTDGAEGEGAEPTASAEGTADRRVLFDVNHPAQVHLFRPAIRELERQGNATFVASRDKEVTVDLLDAYGIDHDPLTARGDSFPGLVWELLVRERKLAAAARTFDPDVIVSRLSPAAAHVSALLGVPNVVVSDTLPEATTVRRIFESVTLPFVDRVCAPPSFDLPVDGSKRRPLDFQELAYLHPQYFTPDASVLAEHGIDAQDPFFVVRVAGWDAYHDVGHQGLSPDGIRELIGLLEGHGSVYLSAEGDLPPELGRYRLPTPPEAVHQVLYFADLYVGDSGTMSTEAAVLGTPAIRTNSMVGTDDENVFRELEDRYELLRSFAREDRALAAVRDLLADGIPHDDWRRRRNRLLADQPDVTTRMVEEILDAAPDQ